jgi:hypothetical protein
MTTLSVVAVVLMLTVSAWTYWRVRPLLTLAGYGPRMRRLIGARMLFAGGVWEIVMGAVLVMVGGRSMLLSSAPALWGFGLMMLWWARLTRRGLGLF